MNEPDESENKGKRVMVSVRLDEDMVSFLDREVRRLSVNGYQFDRSKIIRYAVEMYRKNARTRR